MGYGTFLDSCGFVSMAGDGGEGLKAGRMPSGVNGG
jgi:hypothetical protein